MPVTVEQSELLQLQPFILICVLVPRCVRTLSRPFEWRPRVWGRNGSTPSPAKRTPTHNRATRTPPQMLTALSSCRWSWLWVAPTSAASTWLSSWRCCKTCFHCCTQLPREYRDRWVRVHTHTHTHTQTRGLVMHSLVFRSSCLVFLNTNKLMFTLTVCVSLRSNKHV